MFQTTYFDTRRNRTIIARNRLVDYSAGTNIAIFADQGVCYGGVGTDCCGKANLCLAQYQNWLLRQPETYF